MSAIPKASDYDKLTDLEHALRRPDMYIGGTDQIKDWMWCMQQVKSKSKNKTQGTDKNEYELVYKEAMYVPGLLKIFDEIIVNAADRSVVDKTVKDIQVFIDTRDPEKPIFVIQNDGYGIPVVMNQKEGMYIPEMIFGHFKSGSNLKEGKSAVKKIVGGRFGIGAKATNAFSKLFRVETVDAKNKKKFTQTYYDNMSRRDNPSIEDFKGKSFTRITFIPDLQRFNMQTIHDNDIMSILRRRIYDIAGTTATRVKVSLNNEIIPVKNFKDYVGLYLTEEERTIKDFVYRKCSERWEICVTGTPHGRFNQVSFVNSIATTRGGKHVDHVIKQIMRELRKELETKMSGCDIKPAMIKNNIRIFVRSIIEDPTFNSQSKEALTLPPSKFGSKCEITESFIKKIVKCKFMDSIFEYIKFKNQANLKKTDGKKTGRVHIEKLTDANWAGTKKSNKCILILTEGDSAKATAESARSVIENGTDRIGIFPLRGKLLNVREAGFDQLQENAEIIAIKKIMAFQQDVKYTSTNPLRYGKIWIMADQDVDGFHIRGLILNMLEYFWPELLQIPNFVMCFSTPIVICTKKTAPRKGELKEFFTLNHYETWKDTFEDSIVPVKGPNSWTIKYFKGLGSITAKEAKQYFKRHQELAAGYTWDDTTDAAFKLGFSKRYADSRKKWLSMFNKHSLDDFDIRENHTFTEYINKELIQFSMSDNIRSIPNVCDGLKPSQRKIMYSVFKRGLYNKEIKVSQLQGYIGDHTEYHHGENSLLGAIVGLAQDITGINNINLLLPNGQFGNRNGGPSSFSAGRYIFTQINNITKLIYIKQDEPLLDYICEEGTWIEPEYYVPIIPMVLVNGAKGIGTGYSTTIPKYNPLDVIVNLIQLINGQSQKTMLPWYRGFKGIIKKASPISVSKFVTEGIYQDLGNNSIEITELPIGTWTDNYKDFLQKSLLSYKPNKKELEKLKEKKRRRKTKKEIESQPNDVNNDDIEIELNRFIKEFDDHVTDDEVRLIVRFPPDVYNKMLVDRKNVMKEMKLTTRISSTNMYLFDPNGKLKKYKTPDDIIKEFYRVRLSFYHKRYDYTLSRLEKETNVLNYKTQFIMKYIANEIKVNNVKKVNIEAQLEEQGFPKMNISTVKGKLRLDNTEDDYDIEDTEVIRKLSYDYLLGMKLYTLTKEKIDELKKKYDVISAELNDMKETTPKQLWLNDLKALLLELQKIGEY